MSHRIVPVVCAAITIVLLLAFMHRDYPSVGLDFGYFLPRLIDTDLHVRINGVTPQWYTPSFGGGLPAFANPQHSQYSILQLLFLVTTPWMAVLLSTALVSALGFAACYIFLSQTVGLSIVAGTLGAMGVVANGFYIQHIAGGHVGFQLFPLMAVFLAAGTSRRLSLATASALCGLAAAAILHNGGGLIAVLIGGSLILTVQVIHLLAPSVIDWRRLLSIGAIAGAVALALSASKVYAIGAFMAQFPRALSDSYDINIAHALFGLGSQLAGGMMIIPILQAGGFPTQRLDDALVRATGSGVHVSELDVSIQPVLTIALAIGAIRMLWIAWRGRAVWNTGAVRWIPILLLLATVWIAVETTLARGIIYPTLHQLPMFRSMHVNHRVASVFILPITVAGAFAINAWRAHQRPAIGALLLATALMFQASYSLLPELFYRRWFDLTGVERIHQRVRGGERFPIIRVEAIPDENVFAESASSKVPYEPMFGYDNDHFKSETTNGQVDQIRDGRFNLTNPASLVFPEANGLRPFERIHAGDRENLDRFINRQQPRWPHPPILDWLNGLAAITLAGCLLIVVAAWGKGLIKR